MAFFWQSRKDRLPEVGDYESELEKLREQAPVPCIWLFGKTGSGKSSVVRYLTGAKDATIGEGYRPETRSSRRYDFPDTTDPLLTFIDTRGLGEASYQPEEDIEKLRNSTQLMIVTVRVADHALDAILNPLKKIRAAAPKRPVILALTCLHEGSESQDISEGADPFDLKHRGSQDGWALLSEAMQDSIPESLLALLKTKETQFAGLYDILVPIDLTRPEDGFAEPNFGGRRLKQAILKQLPQAYRQALLTLNDSGRTDGSQRYQQTRWQTLASSAMAATAGALPIPWVDIPAVLGIQTHLAIRVAKIYGQEITKRDWAVLSSIAGSRIALGLGIRELAKFIPVLGSAVGAASSFAFTYALGMSWAWYFSGKCEGRVPAAEELREVFAQELKRGHELWKAE